MSEITNDGWRHLPRGRSPAAAPTVPSDRPGTLQIIGTMTNGALVAVTLLIVGAAGGVLLAKEKIQDIVRVEIVSAAQHVARGCSLGPDGIWRDSKKGFRCDSVPPPNGRAALPSGGELSAKPGEMRVRTTGPSVPSARIAPPAQG